MCAKNKKVEVAPEICGHFCGFGHEERFGKVGCASIAKMGLDLVLSAFAAGGEKKKVHDDVGELIKVIRPLHFPYLAFAFSIWNLNVSTVILRVNDIQMPASLMSEHRVICLRKGRVPNRLISLAWARFCMKSAWVWIAGNSPSCRLIRRTLRW